MTVTAPVQSQGAETTGLAVDDVSVIYRNGNRALDGATFSVPRGSITALVGINGSGKSTLFKALMGFVPLASGEISIMGLSVSDALRQNLVAYVPQSEEIDWAFPVLVEDVVMMGRYGRMNFLRMTRPHDRVAVNEALDRVGMSAFRKRQIGELSGGQKKRVFLARALAQEGQVILLDEPFTGVDVTTERQIIELLKDLRAEGRVMLVSTHNLGSVPEFCDRAVLINRSVLAEGPTETVFTQANLQKAFGGVLRHFTLGGQDLHDDDDRREVTVLTDDERPFVIYGEAARKARKAEADSSTTGPKPGPKPAAKARPGGKPGPGSKRP
ncbi:manganese/iron ABC transporter ATP-binding protein [Hoeflea sp.]|uniref:manganese/iron ABC transporter ATP-binding protein n=1 Tax=Hoeflea sp. TaxID=1940281 RepID=UPI0019A32254|nr:manganese/iron ABC transporter ATP-binding protein [Hoeflea sp.]MBC7280410.1 manganese/iron ABC transporter ATP-binding protein [Hoeflea sp.]